VDELAWLIARDPARPLRDGSVATRLRDAAARLALQAYARLGDRGGTGAHSSRRRLGGAAPARPGADGG
jgi:hypothetical protein